MKRLVPLLHIALLLCVISPPASAQVQEEEQLQPLLVTNAPMHGTFYLMQNKKSPPYPFDPWFGQMPIFLWDGVFFVDDSKVDYVSLRAESISGFGFGENGGGMMLMSLPPTCDPCSTNGGATNFFATGRRTSS